jgi:hypothetical protein
MKLNANRYLLNAKDTHPSRLVLLIDTLPDIAGGAERQVYELVNMKFNINTEDSNEA